MTSSKGERACSSLGRGARTRASGQQPCAACMTACAPTPLPPGPRAQYDASSNQPNSTQRTGAPSATSCRPQSPPPACPASPARCLCESARAQSACSRHAARGRARPLQAGRWVGGSKRVSRSVKQPACSLCTAPSRVPHMPDRRASHPHCSPCCGAMKLPTSRSKQLGSVPSQRVWRNPHPPVSQSLMHSSKSPFSKCTAARLDRKDTSWSYSSMALQCRQDTNGELPFHP